MAVLCFSFCVMRLCLGTESRQLVSSSSGIGCTFLASTLVFGGHHWHHSCCGPIKMFKCWLIVQWCQDQRAYYDYETTVCDTKMVSCWIITTKYSWKWISEVVKSVLCMSVCCASILMRSHWSFRLRGKILEVKIFYVLCWVFSVWRWGTGILNKAEMSWHSATFLWMFLMRWQGWTAAILILMLFSRSHWRAWGCTR